MAAITQLLINFIPSWFDFVEGKKHIRSAGK